MKYTILMTGLLAGTMLCGAQYEAEEAALNVANTIVEKDASASGGKCVVLKTKPRVDQPDREPAAIRWRFTAEKKGRYDLVFRVYGPTDSADSAWLCMDGKKPKQLAFNTHLKWLDYAVRDVTLTAGEHEIVLKPRESEMKVDFLTVTASPAKPKDTAARNRYPDPPAYPVKGEHPRVLVHAGDLPILRARLAHPENAPVWKQLQKLAKRPVLKPLDPKKDAYRSGVYREAAYKEIEAKAFAYLMTEDKATGENAVRSLMNVLPSTRFVAQWEITRPVGYTLYVSGLVYDWCYDLMTAEERTRVRELCDKIGEAMEVGMPPVKQGDVTGHGGEEQVFRNLFCYSAAIYDESPELYRVAAGRVFSTLRDARNFFYAAGKHHQGTHYAALRYKCAMFGAWAVRRTLGLDLFDRTAAEQIWYWLYNRLPDGRMMPEGDSYYHRGLLAFPMVPFYNYTFYSSPIAKAEFVLENGIRRWAMSNPVTFLLFNDPQVAAADITTLPLTHYYTMPLPAMTARSGWQMGQKADTAVVTMIGAGYNFNNHQHCDAGSFQIYFRGLLAADLGQYVGGAYGSEYDFNFNKQSIAHNMMLFVDKETILPAVDYKRGKIFNRSGEIMPNNGKEPNVITELDAKGHLIGTTPAHAFGPNRKLPLFSHLKVDLSQAYGPKVKRYFRSFVYINTGNPQLPCVLVVQDRVRTAQAETEKLWVLNSFQKPEITGNGFTVIRDEQGDSGQLKVLSLLPEKATIETASANEFRGMQFRPIYSKLRKPGDIRTNLDNMNVDHPSNDAFRTEIRPAASMETDVFLTVMAVGKAGKPLPFGAELIRDARTVGTAFTSWNIFFSKDFKQLDEAFEVTVSAQNVLVTDLTSGCWEAVKDGKIIARRTVPSDDGTFFFVSPSGGKILLRPAETWGTDTDYTGSRALPSLPPQGIQLDGKTLSPERPVLIGGDWCIPVKVLAGDAYRERPEGFALHVMGSDWEFTAGQKRIRAGKWTVNGTGVPVKRQGTWFYPAGALGTLLGLQLEEINTHSALFTRAVRTGGELTVMTAESPAVSDSPLFQLFDGNTTSYWAGRGNQAEATVFLGRIAMVDGVKLFWSRGKERAYKFELAVSEDGKKFTRVFSGISPQTGTWETVQFPPVRAAFLRLTGFGSPDNPWTSVAELKVLGK